MVISIEASKILFIFILYIIIIYYFVIFHSLCVQEVNMQPV